MSTQSWQIPCPRCGWANSGALTKCAKCGQTLGVRPGLLVAGQSLSAKPEQAKSNKVAKPGGFMPRLIAVIIDFMLLGAILLPINALWVAQLTPVNIRPDTNLALETLQRRGSLYLALILIQLFYFAGSWTMLGATPGQLLMNLRVTDAKAGGVGFFRATLRWFWFTLFGAGLVGVVSMIAGKNKRALHDILAGTYVIQIVDADEVRPESGGLPPAFGGAVEAPAPAPPPGRAPVPAPATAPAPAAATAPAPVVAPVASAFTTGAGFGSARPAAPPSPIDYLPPPSSTQFPAAPMSAPGPAAIYSPEPLPGPLPDGPGQSSGGDDGLYAPPPMMDPTPGPHEFTSPAAAPAEREVYSPQPGQVSERALKSAELYSVPPELAAPAPAEPAPAEAPVPEPAPAVEHHQAEEPGSQAPLQGGELPPFEFPPMAPPPRQDHS